MQQYLLDCRYHLDGAHLSYFPESKQQERVLTADGMGGYTRRKHIQGSGKR